MSAPSRDRRIHLYFLGYPPNSVAVGEFSKKSSVLIQVRRRKLPCLLLVAILTVAASNELHHVSPTGQVSRSPLTQDVIVLVQKQFGIRREFRSADRQQDAVGPCSRRHSAMELRVARALDNGYMLHRFFEHLLERGGNDMRKQISSTDQMQVLVAIFSIGTEPGMGSKSSRAGHLRWSLDSALIPPSPT